METLENKTPTEEVPGSGAGSNEDIEELKKNLQKVIGIVLKNTKTIKELNNYIKK